MSRDAPTSTLPAHVRVLVIGGGFAGLALAIKLREAGERDYLVVERAAEVGGTWRDNTYPGAACDVPSQLYSYSFALNPDWSRTFSGQEEIQDYLRAVAARSQTLDQFVFGTRVEDARWDQAQNRWHVRTSRGDLTASFLVSGAGGLSEPKRPEIEGLDDFGGTVMHSAQWDHDHDLTGQRVAVIGTGASAVQIVPEIAPRVAHVDVYQRTAPWVVPRSDRDYTRAERWAHRHVPGYQRLVRTAIYWGRETYVPAFTWKPSLGAPARWRALKNIERGISDPELRRKVTPTFQIGCKRILLSSDWYPALDRDDVDLVTDRIAKVTGSGIVTEDGTEREVDTIIVATGFQVTDLPIARHIVGRGGVSLAEHWTAHGMQAYKGVTVHGFPNLFLMAGPNTGLGHSSMVFMIESQVAYVVDALCHHKTQAVVAAEPRAEVQAAYVASLQRRMQRTVWQTGGCSSWYLDSHGRNVTLWPRATFTYRRLLSSFDPEAYDLHVDRDLDLGAPPPRVLTEPTVLAEVRP